MSDTPDTHVRLREYIEAILAEREKQLTMTAKTLESRLDHLNSLREDVIRDRSIFVTKDMHNEVLYRLEKMERFQSRLVGMAVALAVVSGLIGALLTHLTK